MKKTILLLAMLAGVISANAQTAVTKNGNVLTSASSVHEKYSGADSLTHTATLTQYVFDCGGGLTVPVYQSKSGKYFCVRTSKKSGNQYRNYLKLD